MAIHEYYKRAIRRKIVFYEEDPPEEASAYLRGYELCRFNENAFVDPTKLADVAAVIFRQRKLQPNRIAHDLEKFAQILLWHDCRVFVEIAPAPKNRNALLLMRDFVVQAIKENKLPALGLNPREAESLLGPEASAQILSPVVRILDRYEVWSSVAADLQNYPPGVSPHLELEIEVDNERNALNEIYCEQNILIRRAFHDCSKVKLVSNSDGRSGVGTYHVYATRRNDLVTSAPPYEYFVKIGDRKQLSCEYLAYRDTALEHIPFHLGPRLRLDRCSLGSQQGIIVSDYVSGSESLRDCARDGRSVPVIATLFNSTLRAWQDGSRKEQKPLQDYLIDRMPNEIPEHRLPLIESYGNVKKPTELLTLFETMPSKPVLLGVVHGDLHALNVLVRDRDAIVIDFEKVKQDVPLLLDLASLEAGLFVDGFVGDQRIDTDILKSIECLYEIDALVGPHFNPCDPSDGSAWFFDCVRQIRMQARQIELVSRQYALTVAVELANKSCKKRDFNSSKEPPGQGLTGETVRALAYVLAERILVKLFDRTAENNSE